MGPAILITEDLEGRQLRASISYIDEEGFNESVLTTSVQIPITPVNDGSASFSINGTPALGQTLSINQTADDPDGNGTITIQWQSYNNDDDTWTSISSEPAILITEDLEGRQLRASISYIDEEGFNESVLTTSVL